MLEHVPHHVTNAFLYFHSAGQSADEFKPFLSQFVEALPTTYLWAGDGVISGSPLMGQGVHYGNDARRYWFTFPMQDASSPTSFAAHAEAMGATLTCCGAYVNALADQIMTRFHLSASNIVLGGFQHGSCVALAAAMLRIMDPYKIIILLEPYVLESYYLKNERTLPSTTVVCIDNQHIHKRVQDWINVDTDREFQSYGMVTHRITVLEGNDSLDSNMMYEVIKALRAL